MQAYWFDGALLLRPENEDDDGALEGFMNLLAEVQIRKDVKRVPVRAIKADNDSSNVVTDDGSHHA